MHQTKFPLNSFNLDNSESKALCHSISFLYLNGITWLKDTVCVSLWTGCLKSTSTKGNIAMTKDFLL